MKQHCFLITGKYNRSDRISLENLKNSLTCSKYYFPNLCENINIMISSTHLHAMVIHFPIALLLIGFLSELAGIVFKKTFFNQAAFYLLILGTFGTIVAYLSGDAAGEGMEDGALGKAMSVHEEAAIITLWLTIATATVYSAILLFKYTNKWTKWISVLLFAAVIGAVSRTAYLGGQLVYKHGAGVELGLPDFSEPERVHNP